MKYRKLKCWKYQIVEPFEIKLNFKPPKDVSNEFIILSTEGNLKLRRYYAWDGASGPCPDTWNIMKGSLVHDALYQLMRVNMLDRSYRRSADLELKKICLENGMNKVWAQIVYWGVRVFAGGGVKLSPEPQIYDIP